MPKARNDSGGFAGAMVIPDDSGDSLPMRRRGLTVGLSQVRRPSLNTGEPGKGLVRPPLTAVPLPPG